MMEKYFNVKIEFNKKRVMELVDIHLIHRQKGYICSTDANNFSYANSNSEYNIIINNALLNICDSSVVSLILSIIYRRKLHPYVGADFFIDIISSKKYKSLFLGSTKEILDGVKNNLGKIDENIIKMPFVELPYLSIEEFDYSGITKIINKEKPDFIWVSLGAPKQEIFMSKLSPYLDYGIMFGVGAILNFYSGIKRYRRAPKVMRMLKCEWLYRIITDSEKRRIFWRILYNVTFHLLPQIPKEFILSTKKHSLDTA